MLRSSIVTTPAALCAAFVVAPTLLMAQGPPPPPPGGVSPAGLTCASPPVALAGAAFTCFHVHNSKRGECNILLRCNYAEGESLNSPTGPIAPDRDDVHCCAASHPVTGAAFTGAEIVCIGQQETEVCRFRWQALVPGGGDCIYRVSNPVTRTGKAPEPSCRGFRDGDFACIPCPADAGVCAVINRTCTYGPGPGAGIGGCVMTLVRVLADCVAPCPVRPVPTPGAACVP